MSQAESTIQPARPSRARFFSAWTRLAFALAALPVLRIWQLTHDTDTTVTTAALFAGAAWQIALLLPRIRQRPRPATRCAAWLFLGLGLWQLAWIGTDDFWFFRVALLIWAAAWLALAWGVAGWVWGWRILAAFAVWAVFCDAPWQWNRDAYQAGDVLGPHLATLTAEISGWILAVFGAPVRVNHQFIQLGAYTVSVGVPCTALPLVKLLWLLLLLATLLLRLDLGRALRLAIIAAGIAFATSVARVMLLAYVVRDPPRFHFWHDPDGGGGGWFTAIGMLALAFLIARQTFRQLAVSGRAPAGPIPLPINAGWVLIATLAALVGVRAGESTPAREPLAPPRSAEFKLVSDSVVQRTEAEPSGLADPNQPLWVRRIKYTALEGPAQIDIFLALIPRALTGDPLNQPALIRQIPVVGTWTVPRGGLYASCRSTQGSAWVTTIAPDGSLIATAQAWKSHLHRTFAQPRRWLTWLAHRAPLRDKRCYWLGAVETGALSPAAPPKLFSDWIAVLPHSASLFPNP